MRETKEPKISEQLKMVFSAFFIESGGGKKEKKKGKEA